MSASNLEFVISGTTVRLEGVNDLLLDARRVGIEVNDLSALTSRIAGPIAARARALVPYSTVKKYGKTANVHIRDFIKPSKSRTAVRVYVGTPSRMPYAAVNHWGRDGSSGPKWLSRAEEQLRPQSINAFADGLEELLQRNNFTG